jgi:hypothetical protein
MIKKFLQQLAIIILVCRAFFPSILLLSLVYIFFTDFVQGKDIIITGLDSRQTGFFFLIGLQFWVLITWYTSRLIAYNHDRLFQIAKKGLYHTPRLLGYLCYSVAFLALLSLHPSLNNSYVHAVVLMITIGCYVILNNAFETIKSKSKRKLLLRLRFIIWLIFIASFIWMVKENTLNTYLFFMPVMQTGYLYLVITRRKISESTQSDKIFPPSLGWKKIENKYKQFIVWIFTDPVKRNNVESEEIMIKTEKNIFLLFAIFSFAALTIYLVSVFSISFARFLSPLPIILLSFAILLGAGNFLSLLSIKLQINFHFLFITSLILIGYVVETHNVSIQTKKGITASYANRPFLRKRFIEWMGIHQQELMNNAKKEFPIYFVISDGGASRSAYWTASVLSVLEKKTNGGFSKNLFCLSGASGGSFGNMAFYGSIKNLKTNRLEQIQSYLSNDFLSFPLVRLLGPDLVIPFIPGLRSTDRASALEKSMEDVGGNDALSKFMKQDLSTMLEENTAFSPVIAINATRMQDGTPGLISNVKFENEISEKRIDILGLLDQNQSMNISTAVVLGARFPYFSPAGRIKDQYFVDGGYFDNSGGGIVHEMILDLQHLITDTLNLHPDHPYQKIRFHVIHISNQADGKNKIRKIHPLVNDLAAPIKTIMGSYASQTDFNNLRLYKYLLELYDGDTTYHTINLYQKGETDFFPMNWSISNQSLQKMNKRLKENVQINELAEKISGN